MTVANYVIEILSVVTDITINDLYNDRRIQGRTNKFKKILNEIKKKTGTMERTRNKLNKKWSKNETKQKLNMLDDEINNILAKLDENLTTLELRCIFCEKQFNFKKERELRLSAKENINKIERLKEEVENEEDELLNCLLDDETNVSKLLTNLEYEKHDA